MKVRSPGLRFGVALVAVFASAASAGTMAPAYDLLIRGGTVYTGDAPPFVGDVAVKGDRIVYVGPRASGTAARSIDGAGMVVAPGFIDTDMLAPYANYREQMQKQIPAGRFARPEDIAALVGFLISPGAAYITGAVLPIDGGLTATIAFQR